MSNDVISCANNVVAKPHLRLLPDLIPKNVILQVNEEFIDWISAKCAAELVLVIEMTADKLGRGLVLSGALVDFSGANCCSLLAWGYV